jgi:hypothetical protein
MKTISNNDLINNAINRYDEMIYQSRPVKFDEFISDKYNKVHVELFNDALNKYYNSLVLNLINHKFMFEFFKLFENTYNEDPIIFYDNFYQNILLSNYIRTTVKQLSIDENKLYKYLFDLTNEFIDNIKHTIIDNDVLLDSVNNIIKTLSYIGDFRIIYLNNAIFLEAENENEIFNHEFASYIVKYESDDNTYTIVEENFFMTENEDYVFILENENGVNLAYNKYGEFILMLDDAKYNPNITFNIFNYLDQSNKSILKLFREYVLSLYKINHKVIEIKNDEYWMPSSIIIISNVSPYTKKVESLEKYWNNIQSKDDLNVSDIKLTDYDINDAEIIDINYVSGKAQLRSKLNDMKFEVPFEYINKNLDVNEKMILNLTK